MRLKLLLSATLLPLALSLSGCGTGLISGSDANVASAGITGNVHGGQFPISGATINVYSVGNSGYGSSATLLASTTTNSNGGFGFAPNAYTCANPNAPVYILSIGGNAGSGTNANAVIGSAVGSCAAAHTTFVQLNEVTTVALAYSLSHFFTTTLGGASNDDFGGPGDGANVYSDGISRAMFYQVRNMVNINTGGVNAPYGGVIDSAKIYSIANILASCVNSKGTTSGTDVKSACGKLFKDTTPPGGVKPTDTLQAAVQMALYPAQNVNALFALVGSTPVFANSLTAAPNDWTIGISYTAAGMGLGVDSGTVSNIDIDSSGRIWFPSNLSGAAGAAYFDPSSSAFYVPYNGTSMVHPQEVAIDATGNAWFNDSQSSTVSSFNASSPMSTSSFSLPFTFTNSVTVGSDDSVVVGLGSNISGNYGAAAVSADRTTYLPQGTLSASFPFTTLAADASGDEFLVSENLPATRLTGDFLTSLRGSSQSITANDNAGQVIFTGNDFIAVRSYAGAGNANDGLCFFSQAACFTIKGGMKISPIGIAIDGAGTLWLADSASASVQAVFPQSSGAGNATVYLNTNDVVPGVQYLHDSNNGGTMVTPYGIAIDDIGNVWVSNAGCTTTTCTPGSFVLSEIVGAAAPTITPVSAQITGSNNLVGTEPTQ
jgi:hypothetical protein